jgi:hypothetical protein
LNTARSSDDGKVPVILEGGPATGTVLRVDADGDEIVEVELGSANPALRRIAVYRRALYMPARYVFQGMKPQRNAT